MIGLADETSPFAQIGHWPLRTPSPAGMRRANLRSTSLTPCIERSDPFFCRGHEAEAKLLVLARDRPVPLCSLHEQRSADLRGRGDPHLIGMAQTILPKLHRD